MSYRLEIVYDPPSSSGETDFSVACPTGGAKTDVTLDSECETADDMAQHVEDKLNAAVTGSPFAVSVNSDTGQYTISATSNFDLDVGDYLQDFMGLDASYTNVGSITGTVPPSQYRPPIPFRSVDPIWRLTRHVTMSASGRFEGDLVDTKPVVELAIGFYWETSNNVGDWSSLRAFWRYASNGARVSLWRGNDSTLYNIDSGTVNADGRSVIALLAPYEIGQAWLSAGYHLGKLDTVWRIIEGY